MSTESDRSHLSSHVILFLHVYSIVQCGLQRIVTFLPLYNYAYVLQLYVHFLHLDFYDACRSSDQGLLNQLWSI